MLEKLNNEQLEKLLLHAIGMNRILMKAYLPNIGSGEEKALGESFDILMEEFDVKDCFLPEPAPLSKGVSFSEIAQRPFTSGYAEECRRKEQDMNLLCGRWMADNVRRGIEISRAGEHFILTYLKRNGYPSDERYVLVWLDDDVIYYYGYGDRITVVALNTESDTLMISPGADYTRQAEEIK